MDEILAENPNCDICIMGDYNLPNINWHSDLAEIITPDIINCSPSVSAIVSAVAEHFNMHNLVQHNNIRNARGVILDLVFQMSISLISQQQ